MDSEFVIVQGVRRGDIINFELMNPEFWNIFGTFLEHGTKWGQKWDMRLFALISHDLCQK